MFIDKNSDNLSLDAKIQVKSISSINKNTVVFIYVVEKSVDFCPDWQRSLCLFKGAYPLNVVKYDASIECLGFSKTVVIKDLFTDRQKALVWNDTKL